MLRQPAVNAPRSALRRFPQLDRFTPLHSPLTGPQRHWDENGQATGRGARSETKWILFNFVLGQSVSGNIGIPRGWIFAEMVALPSRHQKPAQRIFSLNREHVRELAFEADGTVERSVNGSCDCPQAQMTARRSAAAQTAIAATNAESNARSFLRSVRDVSYQPSYVRMLVMVPSPPFMK
jgi:hypothetical protein